MGHLTALGAIAVQEISCLLFSVDHLQEMTK